MVKKPEIGDIVYHKIHGLKAQVLAHFIDTGEYVEVILFPQNGVDGNNRYGRWYVSDIVRSKQE